ncbi:MAG: SDR family oxidoreductase [Clostridia bacterium]|nr:SDR family oxidoreductase [Clostridia bacterium]
MKNAILITGAASGFGLEYTKLAGKDHYNMVLVDINEAKLAEVKADLEKTYGVEVYTIVGDLSKDETPKAIYEEVKAQGIEVECLINNAGFGDFGRFIEIPYERERALVGVNCIATMYLTHLFANDMVKRGHGRILNTGSIASYLPGPFMPLYYATKAFDYFFSEAVAMELKGTGVTVTCLIPGPTKTGFESGAKMKGSKMFTFKPLQACTQDMVAKKGYEGMIKGRLLVHTHWKYEVFKIGTQMTPDHIRQLMCTYINIGSFNAKNFKAD